ncbi:MAG TPA: MFS transporter, partial [Coxiellaceae bacterium]|nr:MFS transporter [Coxiellaceae bacterium]
MKILKNKQTWLLSLYSGVAFAPVSVFGGLWGVAFLHQAYQVEITLAASTLSLIFVGFAIGCPLSGWFSDYIGHRKIIMTSGTIVALISISLVLYLPAASPTLLGVLLFIFGLGASCFFLCFAMIREINSILLAATVLGFMNTFDSLCEALIEPLIGKFLDLSWDGKMDAGARLFNTHDYHLALSVLPLLFIVGLLLLPLIKETYCQQS